MFGCMLMFTTLALTTYNNIASFHFVIDVSTSPMKRYPVEYLNVMMSIWWRSPVELVYREASVIFFFTLMSISWN